MGVPDGCQTLLYGHRSQALHRLSHLCGRVQIGEQPARGIWWNRTLTIGGAEMDTPTGVFPNVQMQYLTLACVEVCPARARHFGDLNDPNSEVSQLLRQRSHFQLLAEKGTHPSVYFLT